MGSMKTNIRHPELASVATAKSAVATHRFLTALDSDGLIAQGNATTSIARVSTGPAANGGQCEFKSTGIVEIEFGGTVLDGASIKADADGKAVAATANDVALGVCNVSTGRASYVAGDIGTIVLGKHKA